MTPNPGQMVAQAHYLANTPTLAPSQPARSDVEQTPEPPRSGDIDSETLSSECGPRSEQVAAPDSDSVDYSRPADVHSLDEMDFHVRKVRQLRHELDRTEGLYRAEMNRMQDRWQERRTILERAIDWHLAPIESYHRAHPKDRTITFSHGDSKLRVSKAPKVTVVDAEAVRLWAERSHPEVLGAPSITAIRKVVVVDDDNETVIDPDTGLILECLGAFVPEPTWNLDTEPGSPW